MIIINQAATDNAIDLFCLGITFTSKPLVVGGLAMEYYGLRKRGEDIDLIITNEDYQTLANKYPERKIIMDDFGVKIGQYEIWRSLSRLDYEFYSEEAIEYESYKVISFVRLFFMTAAAVRSEPEIQKHQDDFGLALGWYYNNFRNKDYVADAESHSRSM